MRIVVSFGEIGWILNARLPGSRSTGGNRLPTARLRFSRSPGRQRSWSPPRREGSPNAPRSSRTGQRLAIREAIEKGTRNEPEVQLETTPSGCACALRVCTHRRGADRGRADDQSGPALAGCARRRAGGGAGSRQPVRTCARRMPAMPRWRRSKRRSRRPGIATCARRMRGTPPAGSRRARCRLPRRLRSNAARWSQSKRAAARRSRSCSRPARC